MSSIPVSAERLADPKQLVGSIVHAIAVLRFLSESDEACGVTAIARALKISPSSCFNITRTLVSEGLLEFNTRRKTYSIGLGTVELASRALSRNDIFPFIKQRLERIANEFELTAVLWRVGHGRRLVAVGAVESNADMQIAVRIGYRVPLFAGASGRCVAAFGNMAEAEFELEFDRAHGKSTISIDDYRRDLAIARERGWAMDRGTFKSGITSVASPIFDDLGAVTQCVSGVLLSANQSETSLNRIGASLRELADAVTKRAF